MGRIWSPKKPTLCKECIICPGCRAAFAYGISKQEHVVIRMVCDGMSNRLIAEGLQISEETVKRHMSNIMDKTGLDNRTALAMLAVRQGWATA